MAENVTEEVNHFSADEDIRAFMEPEHSSPCLQNSVIGCYHPFHAFYIPCFDGPL